MNRRTIVALIVGAVVSVVVIALHAMHVTVPLEELAMGVLSGSDTATRVVGVKAQYALVVLVSFGVAWLVLTSSQRKQLGWPIGVFAIELIALAWVCALFHVFFQPIPSLLALALAFVTASGYAAYGGRSRSGVVQTFFHQRLSHEKLTEITSGKVPFVPEAKSYEVTVVVCDLADKHDLADECAPAEFGAVVEKFMTHATASFLRAGAFIESAAGEGIVAIFGFPGAEGQQAEKATRHAFSLLESFGKMRAGEKDEVWSRTNVHLGISSGTIVITPLERDFRTELLVAGEPVELARRLCMANRFYGSRILIGPRTFELCDKTILARPIDFLSGVDVRERHEIYEPLRLAAGATPDEIARRDSFWSGVVLYREKRWAESYSQFQKARGADEDDDAPLQFYLHRIEPLALQLAMADDE